VFHVQGLGFPADVMELAGIAPKVPILLQDHANRPPRIWRRHAWRRGLALASGITFCAKEQSKPFAAANLLGKKTEIFEIPESSSRFTPGSQTNARAKTRLTGDPCLLWVGHLDSNKDPMTVLDGVSDAARKLPGVQLWCCFGNAPLQAAVMRRIEKDPYLRGRVRLLGAMPHDNIETLMRAADFFVLGSHREGSGYALIEALACGLAPIVTDIPSFRALTGDGAVGRLWPCGNARRLSEAILSIASEPYATLRSSVRAHFDREISLDALGRKLVEAYQRLARPDPIQINNYSAPLTHNTSTPTVSIILPTFNRLKFLRPAVDSVLAQTFSDWELIIADDGSEDETAAYLTALANLPRVRLLRLTHTGNPSAVRNAALRAARGEYVAFLDSDDVWLPTKLEVQLAAQRANTARRWSYTALTRIGESGDTMPDEPARRWVPYEGAILEQLLTLEVAVATPSVLADRHLIDEAGGFDEEQPYFEEYDLWMRLIALSEVSVINEPLVLVRSHHEHYSADRVRVYEARSRLLNKMKTRTATVRMRTILRIERAKTAASLAMAYAVSGRRAIALKTLWSSRKYAWHSRKWWWIASETMGRAVAPSWLQETVRRYRRRL
jgi:GT2 family glycosyltransferase